MGLLSENISEFNQFARTVLAEGRQKQVEAGWDEAINYNRVVLQTISPLDVAILNELGLDYRMKNQYREAEKHFRGAMVLAHLSHDLVGEIMAQAGYIDLKRTAEANDPFYSRGREDDLRSALLHRKRAEKIYKKMGPEWNVGKVNAHINYGLLDHELGEDKQAIAEYTQAEIGCKFLLAKEPEDIYDHRYYLNRLARAAQNKMVAINSLGQVDNEVIKAFEETLDTYNLVGDVRGKTNYALTLARVYEKRGEVTAVLEWLDKADEFCYREENGQLVLTDPVQQAFIAEEKQKFLKGLKP